MIQPTQEEVSPFMTFPETMAYLRVSRSTLSRLVLSGKLIGHRVGQNWRFNRSDVRNLVESDALSINKVALPTTES